MLFYFVVLFTEGDDTSFLSYILVVAITMVNTGVLKFSILIMDLTQLNNTVQAIVLRTSIFYSYILFVASSIYQPTLLLDLSRMCEASTTIQHPMQKHRAWYYGFMHASWWVISNPGVKGMNVHSHWLWKDHRMQTIKYPTHSLHMHAILIWLSFVFFCTHNWQVSLKSLFCFSVSFLFCYLACFDICYALCPWHKEISVRL